MKKNGRKYRKLQREKVEWKKNHPQKAGEPFSKVQKAYREPAECRHYIIPMLGRFPGFPSLGLPSDFFLQKISDTECKCSVCGKCYPIEKIEEVKMEMLRKMPMGTIRIT